MHIEDVKKLLALRYLVVLLLLMALLSTTSCFSVNEQVAKAYIMTTDTVGEEWHEYSQADETLSDNVKYTRANKHKSMNILRDDLAEEIDYQKE